MPVLSQFFAWHVDPGMLLYGSYDPWLVALAVGVAVFSSTMGMQAAYQAGHMPTRSMRYLTLLAGAMALGGGVWAMHFVGMLSFQLCTTVHYNPQITLLSILPSIAASWVALELLSRAQVSRRELGLGGTLVGVGIGAMHYVGMAAMEMPAALRYDPLTFALSIVVAIGLAILALWVRFGLKSSVLAKWPNLVHSIISGSVMGLAIAGMHFTGMAAARFIGKPSIPGVLNAQDPSAIALSITLVSVASTVLVVGATGLSRYRQLIEQLERKSARLNAISNSALDGIIVFDHRGIIEDFNPGAQRIYGWSSQEVIGQSVVMLMPPTLRERAQQNFAGYLQEALSYEGLERDTDGWHHDGHAISIRLVIARMPIAGEQLCAAFISDITERVRMARKLQDSEAQFRTLIANIPGISYRCRIEQGWPMVFISEAVEQLTGFPAGDFLGPLASVRFSDLIPKADVNRMVAIIRDSFTKDGHFVLEFQLRHRDGRMHWMWGNGTVVRGGSGQSDWIDGVLLDITERRQMEEDLLQAKERAEAASAARSTFLANMGHEIRTPMNAIIGFTDVLLSSEPRPEQRRRLETVHKSARKLLQLLNDVLDTSKLEDGAMDLECIDFSLPELLRQICAEQSIHAYRKQLVLHCEIDDSVSDIVKGDPHRLRQVLIKLIGNAIKFTEVGGVTLSVQRESEGVHFTVQDTGIGIAPDRLDHIFDAFTQADTSMSRRFGGTGLGTTISKQLTELMGGRIWANSVPAQGSAFHVLIPLYRSDTSDATPAQERRRQIRLAPMRVLVVDDVEQNLALLKLMLSRQGHTIATASNGEQALAQIEAATAPFDIILMDVQMPVMDGLSACRALRLREDERRLRRVPVLALSTSTLRQDRQATVDAGMDGFITKPIDMDELLTEMWRLTGRAQLAERWRTTGRMQQPPSGSASVLADIRSDVQLDNSIVDVQRGLVQWQTWPSYWHALQSMAREQAHWLSSLPSRAVPTNEELRAQALQLGDVAAKLGLRHVEQHLKVLARHAGQADQADLSAPWQALLAALETTIREIDRWSHGTHWQDEPVAAPTTTMDLPTLYRQLDQLKAAFRRGERLDALLERVRQACLPHVEASELSALLDAVDVFDFDAATEILARITDSLLHLETPHAPL